MKAVAYYRVSTAQQGRSGLGLEAQEAAVKAFCAQRGLTLLTSFTEVESGKVNQRPQLQAAMHHALITGATLLVAKLDRLSRNVAFLSALMETGTKFTAVDMPDATELTLHIMAAIAQAEHRAISTRTKEALAAAKRRGTRLGNPNGAAALRRAARASKGGPDARRRQSQEFAERLRPLLTPMRGMTLAAIAHALNEAGVQTPKCATWYPCTVRAVLQRL